MGHSRLVFSVRVIGDDSSSVTMFGHWPHTENLCDDVLPPHQDIYVWGPPCQLYTQLSSKRREPGYNPLSSPQFRPFLMGVKHIRTSMCLRMCFLRAKVWVDMMTVVEGFKSTPNPFTDLRQ